LVQIFSVALVCQKSLIIKNMYGYLMSTRICYCDDVHIAAAACIGHSNVVMILSALIADVVDYVFEEQFGYR
jgi:hypothetical protein